MLIYHFHFVLKVNTRNLSRILSRRTHRIGECHRLRLEHGVALTCY